MHSLVILRAVAMHGTAETKQKWIAKGLEGKAIGAYAFTEPGSGSDLASLRTTAVKRGDKWIINGAKTFITNGARAAFVLVLTRTDPTAGYGGFTTFVIDTKLPGFSVSRTLDKLGWHSSDTAELSLVNVEVDDGAILGRVGEGWKQATQNLNWERLMLSLLTLGGMRACYQETLRYASERKAFGRSIGEFGAIAALLNRMKRRILLGQALARRCVTLLNDDKQCRKEVALAKRLICEDAIWLADRAIQIHGGYGYTKEFNPEKWWRDLRLMPIGGGTSEIMAEVVAKELRL
jgi:alkylation response protein AidB-like acyl-CoA dehydrogenase